MISVVTLIITTLGGAAPVALAGEGDASYLIDADDVLYVYDGSSFVPVTAQNAAAAMAGDTAQPTNTGFGESSASWMYSRVRGTNGRPAQGWKERQSTSSAYGVRACCRTICTPSKRFWNQASMISALGNVYTTSGKHYGTGDIRTASGYCNVHYTNACMRSDWGDVGTVISRW